ncbi:MauE/DoxX family redox-associated membrane protein [uncultured Flavobacterium sp.]|uniref:MauE/DoxX family redox-associated membrane protein n=1 Tax=uncultured Flavobacterium sp. TaxID=165435 RepID=UPI0025F6D1FD|nr:MauE/DoxX family redox-associated membrane protein [uncultured Flavobacterium sp.]
MREKIVQICRLILILLFAYTTYHKLADFALFRQTLMKSTLIEEYQINFLLFFVPIIELVTIFLLLSEKYILGLYMSLLLMLTFTIYLIVLNNFSFYKGCSCGGVFNEMTYFQHIAVNISLIIISVASILLHTEKLNE